MADEPYNHNLPIAAYRAALLAELNTPPMDKEHKAAIVAELERLGNRTADEDRSGVQSAAAGGNTVGRAPAAAPIQAPYPDPVAPVSGRHADDESGR